MKKIFFIAMIVVSFSLMWLFLLKKDGFNQPTQIIEKQTSKTKSYIFNEVDKSIFGKNVKISYILVNTKLSSIGITSPKTLEMKTDTKNYSGYSLKEYAELGNYKVVQSGGFLNSISPPIPLGYVKIQNKEINDVHKSWLTTGMFCTDGNKFLIERFSSKEIASSWISCIQAGPIMIEHGKNVLDTGRNTWFITGQVHRQSFLCEKSKNELVMGISENLTLTELAKVLTKDETMGFACKNAVALNPKSISGMYIGQEPTLSVGNTDVPLFTAIVVK